MRTGRLSSIPTVYLTDLSPKLTDILVGLKSPNFSFSHIEMGIKLTLAPRSQSSLSMTNFPITHGIEKLYGSFNFGGILF